MKEFWNKRYSETEFAYGETPNEYFKEQLVQHKPSKILLPAEGEGRNAVFAAKTGWDVSAFDISAEGKVKADKLATKHKVQIDYQVGGFNELPYKENTFDCIGLIFAHFPAHVKSDYHAILDKYLCKDGIVIFEAFSKSHLKLSAQNPKAGGPKNIDMLFSVEEIKSDFNNYEIIELEEKEVRLNEGLYHKGTCSVIRFVGRKK